MTNSKENKSSQKSDRHVWKDMIGFLIHSKLPIVWIIICTIAAIYRTKVSLLIPSYMKQFYGGDFSTRIILLLAGTGILRYLIAIIVGWMQMLCSVKITRNIRKELLRKMFKLPAKFYDENTPKSLISRTTDDTTKISEFTAKFLPDLISSVFGIYGTCALVFSYGKQLGYTIVAMIPLTLIIYFICGKMNFKVNLLVQTKLAALTKSITERILRIPLIKSCANEDDEEISGTEDINKFYKAKIKFGVATGTISSLELVEQYLREIIVIIVGFICIQRSIITAEVFIAFYMFAIQFSGYTVTLMARWNDLKGCQGSVRRISQISTEIVEKLEGEKVPESDNINFKNVCFSYGDKKILDKVSLSIPKNKITAFVGPSGAGKSTIFKLIERFYSVDSGEILVGNKRLEDLDIEQWRKSIGYVSQDMLMFSGTIRENLLYGIDRKVTDEEINKALETACAKEFIDSFKHGMDEAVGENGGNLSGGQCRRIIIARALLKNTPYLLLDEITSNLDIQSRYLLEKAVENISKNKTVIMVSHDMKSVRHADNIIVLDNRKVAGVGNHDSLMKSNEVYQRLQSFSEAQVM